MRIKLKTTAKAVITVTFISVLTRILSFAYRIYLGRTIGAESLGIYQIALSVFFMFTTVTSSGLPLTISRKTAELYSIKKDDKVNSLLTSAITVGSLISIISIAIVFLLRSYSHVVFSDVRAKPLFYILIPALLSTTLYTIIRGWLMGKKDFFTYSITELVECSVRVLFGIILLNGIVLDLSGANAAATAFVLSDYLCAVILTVILFVKKFRIEKPYGLKAIMPNVASVTGIRLYSSAVTSLIAVILPISLTYAGLSQNEAVAEYGRIVGMVLPLLYAPLTVSGSLSVVLIPSAATDKATGARSALSKKAEKSLTLSVLCAGLFVCVYFAFGQEICRLLFKDVDTGKYLLYGAIIMLPMNVNQIAASLLNSLGQESKTLLNYFAGTVLLVASILLLTRFTGAFSLLIGLGLCYTLTAFLNAKLLYKYTKFNMEFLKAGVCVIAISLSICILCVVLKNIVPMSTAIYILLCGTITFGAYALSVYMLGFIDVGKFIKE